MVTVLPVLCIRGLKYLATKKTKNANVLIQF